MATIRFTPDDRDERGFVAVTPPAETPPAAPTEPRSLADLLPSAAHAQATTPAAPQPRIAHQMIAAQLMITAAIGLLIYAALSRTPQAAPTTIPSAPSAPTATAAPTAAPTDELIAYWAPNGEKAPAIPYSAASLTATARFGEDWIRVQLPNIDARTPGGQVWINIAESNVTLPSNVAQLPNLERPTARPAAAQQPAPAAQPIEQAPAPTDPPHCATVGTEGNTVEACGYESLDALQATAQALYIEQIGGHLVPLTTATPYPEK